VARPDGDRIRDWRRRKGLSIHLLARRAGLAEKTIRRLERNQVETPHPDTIAAVAGALQIRSEDLFSEPSEASSEPLRARTIDGFAGRPTLAVLRFDELSETSDIPYFAAGLVEDLISRLSAWRMLPIIAPASSLNPKLDGLKAADVGRELGARYLVRGSVRRSASELRITVQLADSLSEHTIWAGRFDRPLVDLLRTQDEISQEIMARVGERVSSFESRRAMALAEPELEAWDVCMQGLYYHQRSSLADAQRASELFERATELDPRLALAWVGRAIALLAERRVLGSSTAHLDQAREWAEKATQCDPEFAQAHAVLASICLNLGRLPEAMYAQERALELDPSSASAYVGRGITLSFQGKLVEARDELLRALALDPCSANLPEYLRYLGLCHLLLDRPDEAIVCFRRSIQHRPDIPTSYCDLAAALGLDGQPQEAESLRKQLAASVPNYSAEVVRGWLHNNAVWPPGLRERYFQGLRAAGWNELLESEPPPPDPAQRKPHTG